MICKAINHLLAEMLAIGMMAFNSSAQVNASAYIEPVRCQKGATCACKPLESQMRLKYWNCRWDELAFVGPVTTLVATVP
jgi:hypothetical protein